jgi:ATP-dependent DNA ligase
MRLWQGADRTLDSMNQQQLAKELDALESTGLWVAEDKCDGHYSTFFKSRARGSEFYSRNCKRQSSLELENIEVPDGLVVAGELGVGTPSALKRRAELGHEFFVAHRILQTPDYLVGRFPRDATKLNEVEQRGLLEIIWSEFDDYIKSRFQIVPRYTKKFFHHYCSILSEGGEGLILKSISKDHDTTFKPNTRSQHWIKAKKMLTVDMVITAVVLSDAKTFKDRGMASSIICGMFVGGKLMPLTSVGAMDHAIRLQFGSAPEKFVGRVVEIGAFEQFDSGALRHPWLIGLRTDKEPHECVWRGR